MKKVFWLIAAIASFASSKLLADTYAIDLNKTSTQYVLQIKRFNPAGGEVGNVRYTFFKKTDKLKQTSLYFQGKEAPWAPLDRSVAGGLGIRLGNLQVWMRDDWRLDGVVISGQSDDNLTIHANRVILGHDAGLILNGNIVASNKTKPAKAIVSLSARGEVVINGDLTVNFPIFSLDKDSTLRVSGSFMGTLPELLTYHRSRMQVGRLQLPELASVRNYGTVICDNDCLAPRAVFTNGERDCSTIPGVASTQGQLVVNGRCQVAELKAKKELIKQRNVCRELVQKYKQEGQDLPLFSPDEEILIIRSEMHRLVGRRLLPQFTDESDQLWQFFLNTVEEHHRLRVEDGVVLDIGRHLNWGEQCKLKKDIVWMVEFNCDGQKTYAIRLYLCQETMKSLYVSPAMVIAGSFNLTADSNWANQGLMEATRGDVNIQVPGGMLLNQGGGILSRTGAVNLSSGVGIANTNGLIQGATGVSMQAPLIMSETQVGREGSNQQFHSVTGGEAEIRSGGDIRLDATEQLVVAGSQIAADGDITLSSGDVLQVMPAVLEYHDEAHEADSSHLIHHRSGIYPALTGRNIELQSRNKLTLVAPTIYGIEEVSVKSSHGLMQIHPFIEMDYAHYTWHSSDFWGSSEGQKTEMKEKVERPKVQAGRKLTLKAHDDLETVAMEARAQTMHLESTRGQVKLGAGRARSMRQEQYRASGWITTTNHDEGYNHLEVIEPILVYDDVRVVGRLMAEVKKGQLAPWVVDLCHVYEVDLREVLEQHEQWRQHTTTMSTPLRTFLMVGLAICTAGWGAEYVATHWASTSTAIAKGAGAALEGITNTLSVSTLANAGDLGKVFKEISNSNYLKNLVASAVSAGLVSKFVDGPIADKALSKGDEKVVNAAANAPKAGKSAAGVVLAAQNEAVKNLSFAQSLGRNLRAAAMTTGVSSAVHGGKVGRNALSSLGCAVVNTASMQVAREIGECYAHGSGDMSWLTHKVCHFVLGGTASELTGGDFLAGGTGAVIGEMVADLMIQRALEQTRADVWEQLEEFRSTYGELLPLQEAEALVQLTYLEYLEVELTDQIERYGRLAAAGTAFVGRMDISAADAAADLAIEYNSIASQIKVLKAWLGANYKKVVWEGVECFIPITAIVNLTQGKDIITSLAEIGLCAIPVGKLGCKVFVAIEKIGKRFPINAKKWAGRVYDFSSNKSLSKKAIEELKKKYPKGVPFTKEGFPDFSQYARVTVNVPLGKSIEQDFKYANKLIKEKTTPKGYTWHYTEKPGVLQLIPTDLHEAVRHTGGKAIERAGK